MFPHLNTLVKWEAPECPEPIELLQSWTKGKERASGVYMEDEAEIRKGETVEKYTIDVDPPGEEEAGNELGVCDFSKGARVNQVRALSLTIPGEGDEEEEPLFDDEDALGVLADQWGEDNESEDENLRGNSVILPPPEDPEPDPKVTELIEAIHRDYDGSVLRTDVPKKNIIPRGPHGEGKIEIRPGCIPKRCHPIHLLGERRQALVDLVKQWEENGKVESGVGE